MVELDVSVVSGEGCIVGVVSVVFSEDIDEDGFVVSAEVVFEIADVVVGVVSVDGGVDVDGVVVDGVVVDGVVVVDGGITDVSGMEQFLSTKPGQLQTFNSGSNQSL